MKVLIIDDDENLQFLTTVWLAKAFGLELHFASESTEALKKYTMRGPYDLVLTDFVHPGLDGVALAKAIRKKNAKQAIAMLTGGMPDSAERACKRMKIPVISRLSAPEMLPELVKAATGRRKNSKKSGRAEKKIAR